MRCFVRRADSDYGLVWKVQGYDDRFPGDLALFARVGVYGTLKRNKIHNMYIGACECSFTRPKYAFWDLGLGAGSMLALARALSTTGMQNANERAVLRSRRV